MVVGGKYLPYRFLLCCFRESRRTSVVEGEHGWGFFGLDCDVGDIVRMDSGDFLNKCEGFGVWDCFCVVKNVRSPLTALQMIGGFGLTPFLLEVA